MSNIWRIFRDDVRFAMSSISSVLVVLAMCLVPTLFAWFSIAAHWEPYDNTSQLRIAVVNEDEGYESALSSTSVNVGDRIVQELRGNGDYNWEFVDEDAALDGVCTGEYYAALVIPARFSASLTAALSGGDVKAPIEFCLNMKENPVASMLAGEGGAEVVEGIRAKIVEVIGATTLGLASDLASLSEGDRMQDMGAVLIARLDAASDNLLTTATQARSLSSLLGSVSSLASSTSEALAGTDSTDASALDDSAFSVSDELKRALDSARSAALSLGNALDDSASQSATTLAGDLVALASSVESVSQSADSVSSSVQGTMSSLSGSPDSLTGSFEGVEESLEDIASKLESSARAIERFKGSISIAIENGDLERIAELIGDDPDNLAEWMSTPVEIERREVDSVGSYGAAMTPFYAVFSVWLCSVLLVLFMRADVSDGRACRYETECGRPLKGYERYLGRFLSLVLIAFVQAAVMCLGSVFFLRVECAHPALFLVAGLACAAAFSGVAYALASLFGSAGKALCVIALVVPVIGAGGEFPLQMMGEAFQMVHPFEPSACGVRLMQESIAGVQGSEFLVGVACLCAFMALSIALGIALRRPCERFRASFRRRMGESALP